MFSFKNKLGPNLRCALLSNLYENYRVIIHCKSLETKTVNKIKSLKCDILRHIPSINCICAILTSSAIYRLLEYPQVAYITFDSYAHLCGNSILASNGVSFQNDYSLTGKGIGVGIIDSGVYPHPDLLNPCNKIRKFVDVVNNLNYPYDDNGHGTFMSGLICGSGYGSKGMYKGVAKNSHIYMIKAFNKLGKGFVSDILFSLETLLSEDNDFNLKIICLPFETFETNEFVLSLFSKLFDLAISKGIVVIVPSGSNKNVKSSVRGIATLKNCITVGGYDSIGSPKIYEYSSCGPFQKLDKPNLIAACVNICSLISDAQFISEKNGVKLYPTRITNLYTTYTGTSCSAAFISGLCALLYENNINLCYKDTLALLKTSSSLINSPKYMQGSGIVNLEKLLP
ncbi:S8 family serine peptidase [Clostridium sp. CM028]|uniref:S8 family serine peptidase n=1 Tax=unclassified Clostridium TaxID=2614128 RepID=UPI001C0CA9E6|nr:MULTISPECIES: S8 family serine peptidase [unclassified Clostridium]MBU3091074.1 S8 family serine peptidase [Clostridium sp. CF011]MBW9144945.1 S8 family serine peptidase [Clostridium sp. CM027]MBW9148636.1 S8 family serine peptidase [Clostridium sp. CM028]UVE40084.1 S8 family serine peptidase [Clostridium sp. CM027]WAG69008.1 S8 family serine peptidase [Clostridium sp. CF011]